MTKPVLAGFSALFFALSPALWGNERIAQNEEAALGGDVRAMISLGLIYHQGDGVATSYDKAMGWYLKAYEKSDGDAFNNIGVMYRDGLGVDVNKKIAYLLFLAVHMEGLGTEATQYRAGGNLSRLSQSLSEGEIKEALSYTWPYVDQVVRSRGSNLNTGPDVLPTSARLRIKDNDWWMDQEREQLKFAPPPPWNVEVPFDNSQSS